MAVIGLDLGATKLSGAVFDQEGEILRKEQSLLGGREGTEVGALIKDQIKTFLAGAGRERITAAGICVPGIFRSGTGRVWAPNIPGWDDYPLLDELNSAVAGDGLRVMIESDRNCHILGEAWRGAAAGCENAVFMAFGTGIGAGIIADGRLLRGENDIAGSIGWMASGRPYRPEYAACGSLEYWASGDGIARLALELLGEDRDYQGTLKNKNAGEITGRDIFSLYDSGDRIAVKTVGKAVEFWGMAVADMVSVFNPEKVILGGGIFGPALRFLDAILDEAKKWAQPVSISRVRLEGSALGTDAGLYGAARLALKGGTF